MARQVFSPGRLKFQYEISRDIVCWSKRTRLTTDPNSDNPDTPFDTAFPRSVRHPITFDVKEMISTEPGVATTGPSGRPYPAPPGPRTTWVAYTGIDGEQSNVGDPTASRHLEGGSGAARGRAAGRIPTARSSA